MKKIALSVFLISVLFVSLLAFFKMNQSNTNNKTSDKVQEVSQGTLDLTPPFKQDSQTVDIVVIRNQNFLFDIKEMVIELSTEIKDQKDISDELPKFRQNIDLYKSELDSPVVIQSIGYTDFEGATTQLKIYQLVNSSEKTILTCAETYFEGFNGVVNKEDIEKLNTLFEEGKNLFIQGNNRNKSLSEMIQQ